MSQKLPGQPPPLLSNSNRTVTIIVRCYSIIYSAKLLLTVGCSLVSASLVMVSGIPETCLTAGDSANVTSDKLVVHFNVHTWQTRQRELWQQPPTASQEDFIF